MRKLLKKDKSLHFIAIGGSAMHNLAIALHKKGMKISGSDDEIFEPSKSRLEKHGLLPEKYGWFPEKITPNLDAVILGMHARKDNPELKKAQEIGLKIYSYPEYLYLQCKDKQRVVIGGSHGKTTITSMVMHVLKTIGKRFDYMVGASIEGFDTMVELTKDAEIAIFEGDEYLSSPIDLRPKFHLYKPHVAVISGIAWDHINVFPTFENYIEQFDIFAKSIIENGKLIYYNEDENINKIVNNLPENISKKAYSTHNHKIENGETYLLNKDKSYKINVFGEHNLQNINAAKEICNELNICDTDFYNSISNFKGANKRLQLLAENSDTKVFLDFAHSPSKLQATVEAVKKQEKDNKLIACMELHTFSSLNAAFLPQYKNTMQAADVAIVYYNPKTTEHKKLPPIKISDVENAFGGNVKVFNENEKLIDFIQNTNLKNSNLLLMSSGNFSGINLKEFAEKLIKL